MDEPIHLYMSDKLATRLGIPYIEYGVFQPGIMVVGVTEESNRVYFWPLVPAAPGDHENVI